MRPDPEAIKANLRAMFLQRRLDAAAQGHSAPPVPTTAMYIVEDPDKFGPGMVVVEDGKKRRMMITKVVVGFAECIWFLPPKQPGMVHTEIVHTSMLTLSEDQSWLR